MFVGDDARDHIGEVREVEGFRFQVDGKMAAHVQTYLDYCRGLIEATGSDDWGVEERISLDWLRPGMFGTVDFTLVDHAAKIVHVVDLKYGRGHVVEVKGNTQFRYYALEPAIRCGVGTVRMTVVQPRAQHEDGPIRSVDVSARKLIEWGEKVLGPGVDRTREDRPEFHAGDHCRWCPALGICEEARRHAEGNAPSGALEDFADPADPVEVPDTIHEAARMLALRPWFDRWFDALHAEVRAELLRGHDVRGVKLVQGRGRRQWRDEDAAFRFLSLSGVPEHRLTTVQELVSPSQAMDLIKSFVQDEAIRKQDLEILEQNHVIRHEGGPRVVGENVTGKPYLRNTAAEDFDIIEDDAPEWE